MAFVQLNSSFPIIQEFLSWVHDNPGQVDDVVALGYVLYKHGIMENFTSYMSSKNDKGIQEIIMKYKKELEAKDMDTSKKLESLTEFYKQQVSAKDTTIEMLKRQYEDIQTASKEQLQMLQQHFQNALDGNEAFENRLQIEKLQCEATMYEKQVALVAELQHYKLLSENLKQEIQSYQDNLTSYKLQTLEKALQDKERMIEMMSKTNAAKGAYGENLVSNILREAFPKYSFTDMSGTDHMTDIHMKNEQGDVILVECKNKSNITKADIDKLYFDIEHVSKTKPCTGAVFVSIHTRNIPGKGDTHFEMYKHTPVLFVGFQDQHECSTWLPKYVGILTGLAQYQQLQNKDDANIKSMNDILEKVKPMVDHMYRLRSCIEKMKHTYMQGMTATIVDMESECSKVIETIQNMLGKDLGMVVTLSDLQCHSCGKHFKNKAGYAAHTRSCKNLQ